MATVATPLLDAETFSVSSQRDALGGVLTAVPRDGREVHCGHDQGGGLPTVGLEHRGSLTEQTVVGDVTYDAPGVELESNHDHALHLRSDLGAADAASLFRVPCGTTAGREASTMTRNTIIQLSIALMTISTGCSPCCDPDAIFEEEIATPEWAECADMHTEDDRTDARDCLVQEFMDGEPAFVRLSDNRGIGYVYFDKSGECRVLTWGGRAGRMGDVVHLTKDCDPEKSLELFTEYRQLDLACDSHEQVC